MIDLKNYKKSDKACTLRFFGSVQAEKFSRILNDSLQGVLRRNFISEGENIGFITASIDGRYWHDTMWTRDAGTMIREFVAFGYTGSALACAYRLIALCEKNPEGYYTFPEKFYFGKKDYGYEVDGTASIVIAFAYLYKALSGLGEIENANEIKNFCLGEHSPVAYFVKKINSETFLLGEGEFGGGYKVKGKWFNCVQNFLVAYSLKIWADITEDPKIIKSLNIINEGISKYFIKDEKLIWCLNPQTFQADESVLKFVTNTGFTGINGAFSMASDVFGFDVKGSVYYDVFKNVYFDLIKTPLRREQFEKYGIYTQFDNYCHGLLSSAYGQGYAMQCAAMMNNSDHLEKMLKFFIEAVVEPNKDYKLTRTGKYFTYERLLSPDYFNLPKSMQDIEEGCGELNLVNVSEYLKVARLMVGVDYNGGIFKPVLPSFITGFELENFPIIKDGKYTLYNLRFKK